MEQLHRALTVLHYKDKGNVKVAGSMSLIHDGTKQLCKENGGYIRCDISMRHKEKDLAECSW